MNQYEESSTPDLDDLQQNNEREAAIEVPVRVVDIGPVQVHTLPARDAVMRSVVMPTDTMQQLVGGNLRRNRMVIWATAEVSAGSVFVGVNKNEVESGTCAIMPAVVQDGTAPFELVMNHAMPVWVRNVSGNPITVSFLAEEWAD